MKNIMLSNNLQWVIFYNIQGSLPSESLVVKCQQYNMNAELSDLT